MAARTYTLPAQGYVGEDGNGGEGEKRDGGGERGRTPVLTRTDARTHARTHIHTQRTAVWPADEKEKERD